ncbi:4-hydroxy-tetrahydrodipicolinate reductase [Gammaproteobacteria bacterium]|nr:4-hydroxy-tetrahydrodipicolinate reductase [Gammaproteobacteria bacterium]
MIKVCINGLSGKMGSSIKDIAIQQNDLNLIYDKNIKNADVLIDFSRPSSTLNILEDCLEHNIPMVIGTTGFNQDELSIIKEASKKIPILLAFNMSKGIYIIKKSIQNFLESNSNKLSCVIEEVHHTEKVDSPSGTAIELKKVIEIADIAKNISSLSIESKRAKGIFGIHKVIFSSDSDYIEFKHEALSRKVFAEGAIEISKLISSKSPKMYELEDFFNAE